MAGGFGTTEVVPFHEGIYETGCGMTADF